MMQDTYVECGSDIELSCNLTECMDRIVAYLGFSARNFQSGLRIKAVSIQQKSDGSILATADFRVTRYISVRGTK